MISKISAAKLYAKKIHKGQLKKDQITTVFEHLNDVVKKLQDLGITDEDMLAAAWLHDVLEDTASSFDEIDKLFGNNVSSLVLILTKNRTLPKDKADKQYIQQLKKAPLGAKLIKLCDVDSNLQKIYKSNLPANYKRKSIMRIGKYYAAIKNQIPCNSAIKKLIDDIDDIITGSTKLTGGESIYRDSKFK